MQAAEQNGQTMALPRFLYSESTTAVPLLEPINKPEGDYDFANQLKSGERLMSPNAEVEETFSIDKAVPEATNSNGRNTFNGTARLTLQTNSDPGDYVFYKNDRRRTKWEEAALYVHEGEDNDAFTNHPAGKWSKLAYTILHNPIFYITDLVTSILLMLLALVEVPTVIDHLNHEERERLVAATATLEILFLVILAFDIALRLIWLRPYNFIRHKRTVFITIILVIMFVEAFVVVGRRESHIRVTRALRPFFFIDTYLMFGVRRVLRQIFQSLRPIIDVLLLLLFNVAFFALIGYYLFARINPDYFGSFDRSYVSLFIALTTANNPDVMMEAYNQVSATPIFFVIYLVITLYFTSNVLLAVVYSTFSDEERKKFRKLFLHKREALHHAYNVLSGIHGIEFHDFLLFMQKYKPRTPEWQVMCIFKALQNKHNEQYSELSLEEFYHFYEVRGLRWRQVTDKGEYVAWYENFPGKIKPFFFYVHKFVKSRWFSITFYIVVLINTLFLVIYTLTNEASEPDERFSSLRKVLPVSFFFVIVYMVEVVLKIIALGPIDYFRKFWNCFDFIIIGGSLILLFMEIHPMYQILASARPIKLIRLLRLKRRYRVIMNTLVVLSPRLISVGLLLVVIYYFFAIIGMEFLVNTVHQGCCNTSWYGVGQFYAGSLNDSTVNVYYLNNFDNVLRSYVTLFILMVVNNWFIIMEGFASEVEQGWLARVYFMIFYIITLVVLQVVISFIVEAFVLNIQNTERRRCNEIKKRMSDTAKMSDTPDAPQDTDVLEDNYRKKEVEVQLVVEDVNKLKYEMTYYDEMTREERSFNSYVRHLNRRSFDNSSAPLKYLGRRLRTNEDIHLLMYKGELPHWISEQEKKLQEEASNPSHHAKWREALADWGKKTLEYLLE